MDYRDDGEKEQGTDQGYDSGITAGDVDAADRMLSMGPPTALQDIDRFLGASRVRGPDYLSMARRAALYGLAIVGGVAVGAGALLWVAFKDYVPKGEEANGQVNRPDITTPTQGPMVRSGVEEIVNDAAGKGDASKPVPAEPIPGPHCTYRNRGRIVEFTVEESPEADLMKLCGFSAADATKITAYTALNNPKYKKVRRGPFKFLQRKKGRRWVDVNAKDGVSLMIPPGVIGSN